MPTTSKLYRKLPVSPRPLVNVRLDPGGAESLQLDDAQIKSLSIHRGDASPDGGLHPSTVEITQHGYSSSRTNLPLTVSIPNATADALAALTGQTRAALQHRFVGRISNYTTQDEGTHRSETKIQGQSWPAVFNAAPYTHSFGGGASIATVLETILNRPEIPHGPTANARGGDEQYGFIDQPIEDGTFSDIIDKFSRDIDVLIRERGNGNLEIWSLVDRRAYVLNTYTSLIPLLRYHAIAPTSWEQPTSGLQANFRVLTRDHPSREYKSLSWTTGPESWRPEETIDLRHVRWTDDRQWHLLGASRRARTYTGSYRLPSLEVDLLRLLSGNENDRAVAGQLLALTPGDPVALANDWPSNMPGISFAQGIDETITPTEWRITLSLVPWYVLFGEEGPMPVGRTWGSAFGNWGDYGITWGEA